MITKSTTISIRFCADAFAVNPATGVRFQIFDENGNPLRIKYDTEGLCSMDDERIAGIHIGLRCINKLFDNIVELRNNKIEQLAKEMTQITGEPVKCCGLPTAIGPTGMSNHLQGSE